MAVNTAFVVTVAEVLTVKSKQGRGRVKSLQAANGGTVAQPRAHNRSFKRGINPH